MICIIWRIASEEVFDYIRSGNECTDGTSDIRHNNNSKRFKKTVSEKPFKAEYILWNIVDILDCRFPYGSFNKTGQPAAGQKRIHGCKRSGNKRSKNTEGMPQYKCRK